jgi:hypothetical protein
MAHIAPRSTRSWLSPAGGQDWQYPCRRRRPDCFEFGFRLLQEQARTPPSRPTGAARGCSPTRLNMTAANSCCWDVSLHRASRHYQSLDPYTFDKSPPTVAWVWSGAGRVSVRRVCKSEAYAQCFGAHISFFSAPTGFERFELRTGIGEFICDECANLCGYADRSSSRSI